MYANTPIPREKRRRPRSTTARAPSTFIIAATEDFTPEFRLLRNIDGVLVEIKTLPEPCNDSEETLLDGVYTGSNAFSFDAA